MAQITQMFQRIFLYLQNLLNMRILLLLRFL
jgi:hypothetical protein